MELNSPDIVGATVENRYSKSMFNSGDSISNSQASEKILKKKGNGFNIASGYGHTQHANQSNVGKSK